MNKDICMKYNLRGIIGKTLTEKEIKKFANQIVGYVYSNNYKRMIIVGKDNRISSDYILSVMQSVLLKSEIAVYTIDLATTPELVYLTKKFKFNLGVMITASHNSCEYNGLKCFNQYGEMVEIVNQVVKKQVCKNYEKVTNISTYKELYLLKLKNMLNPNSIKCIFDCANGASIDIVRRVFGKHQIIGKDTSGRYINDEYGTESLENIKHACKKNKKIGFAFDGDADRVIAVDEYGEVINGDKILYILATQYLSAGDKVVGTVMSSLGLEKSLAKIGIELVREKVGAKNVAKRMFNDEIVLGGESCGHVFIGREASDGILVAIQLLNILNRTGKTFRQLLDGYIDVYQMSQDIYVDNVKNDINIEQGTKEYRIVVRRSQTESKYRVLVEGVDKALVESKFNNIILDLLKGE